MGHKTEMSWTAALVLGLLALVLITGVEEASARTVAFTYSPALSNYILQSSSHTSPLRQKPGTIDIRITENEPSSYHEIRGKSPVKNGSSPRLYSTGIHRAKLQGYSNIAGLGYYKVYRYPVHWETARRTCEREGAHLLILNSAAEAAAVVAASDFPSWSWLGFDDFSLEGEFITLHGTTLQEAGYSKWAPGEPAKEKRCGVADTNGLLGSGHCDVGRAFVCELNSDDDPVPDPARSVGYQQLGNLGEYRVHRDHARWETARRRCEAEGAHLAVANTAVEAAAVFRTSDLPGWFWVGFDDHDTHGSYINFDGQDLSNPDVYGKFAPNEPDRKYHCGIARGDAKLGTGNCELETGYTYVCEKYRIKPSPKPPSPTPPPGYVTIGNYPSSLYKVHRDAASWETARRRCEDEGAHLIFVNSQEEADHVLKGSDLAGWFYVGFDDFSDEGEHVYLDGIRVVDSGYVKWAENEPTPKLNCGIARKDGFLGTGVCGTQRHFLCEWDKPKAPTPPSPYPPGYAKIRDLGVYKVHRDRVAWETARRRCEAEGARLMIVNSQLEADAVLKTSGLPGHFWLGFDDHTLHGYYVTLDGLTLKEAGYEKWAQGEPNKSHHCGVSTVKGLLGTGNCLVKREYICELLI